MGHSRQIPRPLLVLDQVARNCVMLLPPVARARAARGRTARRSGAVDAAYVARYARRPFAMVESAIGRNGLKGARVAEVGPGDNVASALLFLAHGVDRYVAIDRFAGALASERARECYRAVARDLETNDPVHAAALRARNVEIETFPASVPSLVHYVHRPIEEVGSEIGTFDVVASYNVVEHVAEIGLLAQHSHRMLCDGGVSVHRVDFGPHDAWARRMDPLEWLTVPDAIWWAMGSSRGTPNRLRLHEVQQAFLEVGFEVQCEVEECFDMQQVEALRPHLAKRFRSMPLASLAAKTAVVTCRKRSTGARAR